MKRLTGISFEAWVCITPFGTPVVPEVNTIETRSLGWHSYEELCPACAATKSSQRRCGSSSVTPGRVTRTIPSGRTVFTASQFSVSPTNSSFISVKLITYSAVSRGSVINMGIVTLPAAIVPRSAINQCARLRDSKPTFISGPPKKLSCQAAMAPTSACTCDQVHSVKFSPWGSRSQTSLGDWVAQ